MHIVKSKQEFIDVYPYEKKYIKLEDYPKKYPCIVEVCDEDGGIGGGYRYVIINYVPSNYDFDSFVAGFKAGLD